MATTFAGMGLQLVEQTGLALLLEPHASGVIFRAACNTVSVVYPAYASFKAIESKKTPGEEAQWLSYWSIIGLMSLGEGKADDLLRNMPYYYHIKLGIIVWLQMQGAKHIYTHYLRPTLIHFQPKVDIVLESMNGYAMMMYSIYKVPIATAFSFSQMAVTQARDFFKWFFATPPDESGKTQFIRG